MQCDRHRAASFKNLSKAQQCTAVHTAAIVPRIPDSCDRLHICAFISPRGWHSRSTGPQTDHSLIQPLDRYRKIATLSTFTQDAAASVKRLCADNILTEELIR